MSSVVASGPSTEARLFVALWPGPAARLAMTAWQAQDAWLAGAKLTKPEHLHLTLHFIGAVPRERLDDVCDALVSPGRDIGDIDVCLDRAERWSNGVAVLVPRSVPPALLALQRSLGEVLLGLRLPVDRRAFRPHVTLARHAGTGPVPSAAPVRWRAQGYVLVESRGGYHVLRRYR